MRRKKKLVLRKEGAVGGGKVFKEIGSTAERAARQAWACQCAEVGL